jgi:predicted acylesterase/phospholipase RssA
VFCATELQAGNHLYMAPGFLYSYRFGLGRPADLTVARAVQCSACLPGAFAPRRLPTGPHGFQPVAGVVDPAEPPAHMLLNDGGVYDNMGDEWFAGYDDRAKQVARLGELCPPVDEVIVANSSGGWGWQSKRATSGRRELVGVQLVHAHQAARSDRHVPPSRAAGRGLRRDPGAHSPDAICRRRRLQAR